MNNYKATLHGYHFEYDGEFINIMDISDPVIESKVRTVLLRVKTDCNSQKEFEMECIYAYQKLVETF
jgi:hypothetical protein